MDSLFEQTDVRNFVVQMLSVSVKAQEAINHGQELSEEFTLQGAHST